MKFEEYGLKNEKTFLLLLKMGEKYEKRYKMHFKNPDIIRFDMQHEAWRQPVLEAIHRCMSE